MALSFPEAAELSGYALSRAVDVDPRTYFESKQGSSPTDAVASPD